MSKSEYVLGESAGETARLAAQAQRDAIEPRLRWAGLREGLTVVDAGCGPGETTRAIGKMVGPSGRVTGFDISPVRVEAAKAVPAAEGSAPLQFLQGDVFKPPLPEGEADFVFTQYVLEHIPNPQEAVLALTKLLKPGGKLLMVDVDGVGGINYPLPPILEEGIPVLLKTLGKTGFDAFVGRKLYSFAVRTGLKDVSAMLFPAVLAAGPAPMEEQLGWKQRLEAIAPLSIPVFGTKEKWEEFVAAYLSMLADPTVFKYTLGMAVQGVRP